MRPRSALFTHQVKMTERLAAHQEQALLVGVGYGKTAATLTALLDRNEWPVLVVAPKRVARHVWPEEARAWEHFQNLTVTSLHGDPSQRTAKLALDSHVETISYESLLWLTDEVDLDQRYRAIVFDELSKMKTPGTKRFRRMRARGTKIPTRIGLTGTPVPNHLLDLWGEMFMVAGEKRLGPTYSAYQERYFTPVDYFQRQWELKEKRLASEIHRRVKPFAFVVEQGQNFGMPTLQVNTISVPYPEEVARKAATLESELFVALDSGVEIEALSASTVAMKLQQFAGGAVYLEPGKPDWEKVHDEKIDALEELVEEMQGEPVMVFYWFKHEEQRIRARLGKRAVGIDEKDAISRWNWRHIEVLLVHPASAGHGLNLQHGGSNIVWFTLPWSHELWVQANGRLVRPGQSSPVVMAHVLQCGPVDERVAGVLTGKGKVERDLMDTLLGI